MGFQEVALKINDFNGREATLKRIFEEKDNALIDLYALIKINNNFKRKDFYGYDESFKAGECYLILGGERLQNKEEYMSQLLPLSSQLKQNILGNVELMTESVSLFNEYHMEHWNENKVHKSKDFTVFCGTSAKEDIDKVINTNTQTKQLGKQQYSQAQQDRYQLIGRINSEINIVDYLMSHGYNVKKVGYEYTIKEHDSIRINSEKNLWAWNSKGTSGHGVISFLEEYEGVTREEAIKILKDDLVGTINQSVRHNEKENMKVAKGEIELPEANEKNSRAIAYLSKTRKIDYDIVKEMINKGDIYEDTKHNVVFLGKDSEGVVKYATKRGSNTYKKFVGEVTNSDKRYGFNFKSDKNTSKLYVFESPIDLLSHMTLTKRYNIDYNMQNRLSLGGVSDVALEQYLKDNPNINELFLCLDNDDAGREATAKIFEKYNTSYLIKVNFTKQGKDYNEYLLNLSENSIGNKIESAKQKAYTCKNKDNHISKNLLEQSRD